MIVSKNIILGLTDYIKNNEVVYQFCDELIELSNNENPDNRQTILDSLVNTSSVEVYEKGSFLIHESFEELDNWSMDNDCLFLLVPVELLICIPKISAISANLIIE
jgi:hypothetical protein